MPSLPVHELYVSPNGPLVRIVSDTWTGPNGLSYDSCSAQFMDETGLFTNVGTISRSSDVLFN